MLISATPELPGLIAASVWMKSSYCAKPTFERPTALTMPAVTVWLSENGLPIASTHSPTFNCAESPHGTTGRPVRFAFTSAMSVSGSVPMMRPRTSRLSGSAIVISVLLTARPPFSPPMTWLLVTMYPSAEMMTPEPRLIDRRSREPKMSSSPKK